MPALVPMSRVRELAARGRTAMVVGTQAFDFTDFQDLHPGGKDYLLAQKGKVATAPFTSSHPLDIIVATLSKAQLAAMLLGDIDAATIEPSDHPAAAAAAASAAAAAPAASHHASPSGAGAAALPPGPKPTLDSCLNIYDFEAIAAASLSEQALAYYSSGGDDEITLRENHSAFHRLWMRPRVMVNVKAIDMSTTLLGARCALPLFLSAVAMCKMGHPEGEAAWMRAAGREGVVYMVPTLSGCSFGEIMGARATPAQPAWFQLYVNPDREKTRETVQRAEAAGCSALFITVDAPQLGNREKDRRVKITHAGAAVQGGVVAAKSEGTSKALTTFIDPSLCWEDLPWFRSITKMKIILKGVGTAEDAVRALESGCDGVLLSNHGGRQLDFARSGIEVLPEAMAALRAHKSYTEAFEVYVDGGVRRGTDIFKALALGARGVGLGRPALYAMSAFGADGVARMLQILKGELEMTMRLMGTPTLADINPRMVITDDLHKHSTVVPQDFLQAGTYIPAVTQAARNRYYGAAPAAVQAAEAPPAAPPAVAASVAPPTAESPALQLLWAVGQGLLAGILTPLARTLVHRTSLLLLLYCVAHAAGNLLFLGGAPLYNAYGALLNTHWLVAPCVRAFEVYLVAATLGHAASGAYLTWKDGKLASLATARLALTGALVAAGVAAHLAHFRLDPSVHADLHGAVARVLGSSRAMAGAYVAGSLAVGAHAYWGWEKAARKMKAGGGGGEGSDKGALGEGARALGSALIVGTTAAFCAVAVAAHVQGSQAGAGR